jgi:hypothetical protein
MSVAIRTSGIEAMKRYCTIAPEIALTAARIAINDTARDALKKDIPNAIQAQVKFPDGYLKLPDRLSIERLASNESLEATILGRDRPTSLARFTTGLAAFGVKQTTPVRVEVKPGHPIEEKRVFAVRLNAGADNVDNYNVGLAIRLKGNEVLARRSLGNSVPEIFPNVYLLYGPSVNQVFSDVADEIEPAISDNLESEFLRQFVRLSDEA